MPFVKDKKAFLSGKLMHFKWKSAVAKTPATLHIPENFAAPAAQATKRQIEELQRKRSEREAAEMRAAQEVAGKKLEVVVEKKKPTASDALSMIGFHPVSSGSKPPLLEFYEQRFAELGQVENRED